ncbi:anaerobic sulfatase maturase [Alginatibacterium sediminis]|uniref:Anaerobic sulfatase maturase n=1 Tax=Alginatibacterium sediminis TaxID=2164068 RepID=A0A420E710_9ALTE|nr:anaerobic sulfatase maturase [Alginatibacterium sediminis]RKF13727.1 anaerobic sulfatase maturase [Alginatibacterium sediminis]
MSQPYSCHVMAKPSGSICNIDCHYCFYLEKEKLYPERNSNWQMSDETLELYIKQQIEAQPGDEVDFAWQGGEPTLLGIDFYRKAVSFCKRYGSHKNIRHAFQTNAILLNDEWCTFLKENDFLVGVSIDGPEHLHDHYRVTSSGKATHAKVMQGISLLKKHNVEFNTLTVISDNNAKHAKEVYEFLIEIGSRYLQFIPLVEREIATNNENELRLVEPGNSLASLTPWSVPSWQYGEFLNQVFDIWIQRDVGRIFVQTFDSTLASWLGQNAGICIFAETCGHALALEANGDLYNCDHFVYPDHKLGNIHDVSIYEMNNGDKAVQFGLDKKDSLTEDCKQCEFRFACHGGCPKHRFAVSKSGKPNHNYFCEGYKHYFAHTSVRMKQMGQLLQQQRPAAQIMDHIRAQKQQSLKASPGRNDPCPCGSSLKFKKCCGR